MKYFLPAIYCFLMASCVSTRYIDIQVLEPASVKMPLNIPDLYISEPDTKQLDADIAMNAFIATEDTTYQKQEYTRVFVQAFDSAVEANLRESPALSNTTIIPVNESDLKNSKGLQGDVVLSIKKIFLTDSVKPDDQFDFGFAYYSFYDISYRVRVEATNFSGDRFYNTQNLSDTLSWRGRGNYIAESVSQIPPVLNAIAQAGEIAGTDYAKKIMPHWITEERTLFYSQNKYMRQGYKLFLENKLPEAIESWKYLYDNGTSQLASIAAHNIAVMYEMMDDVKSSETWLSNSLKNKWHFQTENYLVRIRKRVSEKPLLNDQMK